MADEYLTAEEAAKFLGLTVRSLHTMASRGQIPSCRPKHGRRRYRRADLEEYLQYRRVTHRVVKLVEEAVERAVRRALRRERATQGDIGRNGR